MAKFELKLPKMGESVAEATINSWLKDIGDRVEVDESLIEISTDKVDSDVPSEVSGVLIEKKFGIDKIVKVGETFAIIETDSTSDSNKTELNTQPSSLEANGKFSSEANAKDLSISKSSDQIQLKTYFSSDRFYSPLVKNIAKKEGIDKIELDAISGTGKSGRVTKKDILNYLKNKTGTKSSDAEESSSAVNPIVSTLSDAEESSSAVNPIVSTPSNFINIEPDVIESQNLVSKTNDSEIIEMTRMGKLISKHMLSSLQTSAHVQSFIEVDVTKIWDWRNKNKDQFFKTYSMKITLTPIFMEAVAKALNLHPMLNISVDGDRIVKHKFINLGMATALPDGNLIVPVIKNADQLNLKGMTTHVNDLAKRARLNQLKPEEVQNGTYTVTNVGVYGSIMGTPIINQPQVGILAIGAVRKVPSVIETIDGDFIGIRQKVFLSHSYDHRVINGALGGNFLKTVKEILESWDENRSI